MLLVRPLHDSAICSSPIRNLTPREPSDDVSARHESYLANRANLSGSGGTEDGRVR
jgi:hypothetical protein